MAFYTVLNSQDKEYIAEMYSLDVLKMIALSGGAGNSSFKIETKQFNYIFTIFEEIPISEVEDLVKLLNLFKKENIPSNQVIADKNNQFIMIIRGKPAIMKMYLEGDVTSELTLNQMHQIGFNLAKVHLIPSPSYLKSFHNYGVKIFPNVFDAGIDLPYEEWLKEMYLKYMNISMGQFPAGIVHGDLFYDNVLFGGDEFVAIIDFEEVSHFPLIFDIGMTIVGCCLKSNKIDEALADSFLAGYQSIRPLLQNEKEYFLDFCAYGAIATSFWRYKKYNILSQIPEKRNHHWKMVEITKEILKSNYFVK
jgi:homoserine kinase type II